MQETKTIMVVRIEKSIPWDHCLASLGTPMKDSYNPDRP